MKKNLCLILSIVMLLSMCACGQSSVPTTEAPAANDGAAAGDLGEPVVLTAINAFTETDFSAMCIDHFCDLVEEKSGGNITFTRYFGGSFCTVPEEFGYVSSGAADFATILPDTALEQLLYWNTALSGKDMQNAMDVANHVFFENPETAALCDQQAADAGVKILGVQTSGLIANVCTKPVSSYADMVGLNYGTDFGAASYEAMGFNIVSTTIADVYEALSRGMIDCSGSSLSAVVAYKWYEVAPNVIIGSDSSVACYFTFNRDRWDSLTPAQQELIQECVDETIAWEMDYYDELAEGWIKTLEDAGCTVTEVQDEDKLKIYLAVTYQSYLGLAESLGLVDNFTKCVEEAVDFMGFDLQALVDEYGA